MGAGCEGVGLIPRIVANILCHNDRVYLENLLPQVASFADHIIVVDDCSTDFTRDYLDRWPMVERIERKFDYDFAAQRNVALDAVAEGDWVFRIDSDELPTERMISSLPDILGYFDSLGIDRIQVPIYHLLNFSMCKSEIGIELRLFKKNSTCRYEGKTHEQMCATFPGLLYKLPEYMGLVHFKYMDNRKVAELQTTYIEKGVYEASDVKRRMTDDAALLPHTVSFDAENLRCFLQASS